VVVCLDDGGGRDGDDSELSGDDDGLDDDLSGDDRCDDGCDHGGHDVGGAEFSDLSDLTVDGGCLYDLLIYGLCVLDDGGYKDITLQDGLDLVDDGLLDDLLYDGCVYDLGAEGGITLGGGEDNVLGDGGTTLDDGCSDLGGELSLLDDGGLDLSLVHHLGDLLDIELLALSVDDGLDLFLLNGVDSLLDDDVLLDGLDDGGLGSDQRGTLGGLDVGAVISLAESISRVDDSITVSVEGVGSTSLSGVDDSVAVSV